MNIELRGVIKKYRSVKALDDVSLLIEPGQVISLLGPNGAGKTTFIRCLAGIARPDKGDIFFDEQKYDRNRMDLRNRLHFLPDFPQMFWDQSVLRNITIAVHLYGVPEEGLKERIVSLLRDFDLLPLALRPVQSLSRGQAYKAGLVALIAVDRDLWLLDEPFASGMDPHGIDAFKRHARAAAARGKVILYSTQILDVAERFSDRVCLIHKGEIRAYDTLARLREQAQDKNNVLEEMFRQLRESGA